MAITEADLTQEIFEEHGMASLPPMEAFKLLDSEEPEILVFVYDTEVQPQFVTSLYTAEVYYCISPNNTDWYIYRDGLWIDTTPEEFLRLEWNADEMALIPQVELEAKFGTDAHIYLKACAISNKEDVQPSITDIYAVSVQSYYEGQDFIYSSPDMDIDTKLWLAIEGCFVSQQTYAGSKIRFAVSSNLTHWQVFKGGSWKSIKKEDVVASGMSAEELMSIDELQWEKILSDRLRLCVGIYSPDRTQTPKLFSVHFIYRGYSNPTESNQIEIKTPSLIYNRNILSDKKFIYEEFPVEGIGFDSPDEIYNFYTTPNKIVLRVLNMGTLIGTRTSEVFKAVIVNTWEKRDYQVSLTMKTDAGVAIPKDSFCLLKDAEEEEFMTVGELSFSPPENFKPEYPLNMRLNAQERKVFYFRLTPNATTIGVVEAKISASALEI